MSSRASLKVQCRDRGTALRLASVLLPDNGHLPNDQSLMMQERGRALNFEILSPRAGSLLSSAISLITDVGLFQEVSLLSSE
jgi:hypothetical protein